LAAARVVCWRTPEQGGAVSPAIFPTLISILVLLPVPLRAQTPGAIEGVVRVGETARRTASRYAGGGPGGAQALPEVPALVYVVETAGGVRPAAAPLRLAQKDTAFQPTLLIVPRGATVAFPNEDPFFHNVFSYSKAKRFDLGRYPRGESKSVTFEEAGVVRIFCEVHKWMRAVVLVVDNPYHAQVGADGSFAIRGVPPGRYRVVVWHPDRREQTVEVTVPAGGTARLSVTL
jgi:plastocyanin